MDDQKKSLQDLSMQELLAFKQLVKELLGPATPREVFDSYQRIDIEIRRRVLAYS